MVVDSYTLNLPKGKPGRFAISNADPLECNGTISYCTQLREIPLDAIWLISTSPHFPSPSSDWGRRAELRESYPLNGAQHVSQQSGCDHAEEYVTSELRRLRMARISAPLLREHWREPICMGFGGGLVLLNNPLTSSETSQ